MRGDVTCKVRSAARNAGYRLSFVLSIFVLLSMLLCLNVSAQGGVSTPAQDQRTDAASPVIIRTNPTTLTVNLNSTFNLNIIVEAGTNYVKTADLRLSYDRRYLRITADATPGNQISSAWWLWNNYNNYLGNTKFAFMLLGTRLTGSFRFCTLHLKAVQRTPAGSPALITAWTGSGAPLLCDRYGKRVASTWVNAEITVQ